VIAGKVWVATAMLLAAVAGARAGEEQVVTPGPGAFARPTPSASSAARAAAPAARPAASARPTVAARPSTAASVPRVVQARPNEYAPEAARQAVRSTAEQIEERSFIRQAAVLARFELEASKLAITKAHAPAVRALATDLHQQQDAASGELLRLLHARSMAMPMMENTQRKTLTRLGRTTGPRFDREFIEAIAPRQQRDKVLAYERALALNGDPAVRAWAERQLPRAREQMAAVERLASPVATAQKAPGRTLSPTSLSR
jgi:predicted outer membrane protein